MKYKYDTRGRVIKSVNSDGIWSKVKYDAEGNATVRFIDESDTLNTNEFDAKGRLRKFTSENGGWSEYDYDERNTETIVTGKDSNGNYNILRCRPNEEEDPYFFVELVDGEVDSKLEWDKAPQHIKRQIINLLKDV